MRRTKLLDSAAGQAGILIQPLACSRRTTEACKIFLLSSVTPSISRQTYSLSQKFRSEPAHLHVLTVISSSAARSSRASQPAHLSLFGFTAVEIDCSATGLSMKAAVLLQHKQAKNRAPTGSCAARKRHRKQWPFLVNVRGKTGQLAPVVCTSCSKATAKQQDRFHRKTQKLAA